MIIGYYTVEDRNNPDIIETEGPFKCTRPDAWLGHGYYFWDTRIQLAHDWGRNFSRRGYVICSGEIADDPTLLWNLDGIIAHQEEFEAAVDMMVEANIIKNHDNTTVGKVITFLKERNILQYKAIRAADENKDTYFLKFNSAKQEKMRLRQRVQICLLEKTSVLLRDFKIVYPDKYC